MPSELQERKTAPRLFISYSLDSPEHIRAVFELCEQLRTLGLDCRLDQHQVFPSQGWAVWAEEQMGAADCILVVCTPHYLQLFNSPQAHGAEVGAGCWQGAVLNAAAVDRAKARFVPVLLDREPGVIPAPLQSLSHFLISDARGLELLAVYLGEKLATNAGPRAESLPPMPRRQEFSIPLPLCKPWHVPGRLADYFHGRDKERKRLDALLLDAGKATVVREAQGVGASQLALEHVERRADDYAAVFWLEHGAESFLAWQLDHCCRSAGCGLETADPPQAARALADWLSQNDRWLLVLDSFPATHPLEDILLEGAGKGSLLRLAQPGETFVGTSTLSLGSAPEKDILAFFRLRTSRRSLKKEEREACLELARLVGPVHLGLNLAAAWVAQHRESRAGALQGLLHRLQARLSGLQEQDPEAGFRALLHLCLERATAADPKLRTLLALAAALDAPQMLGERLLKAVAADAATVEHGLHRGLLLPMATTGQVTLHHLSRRHLRVLLPAEERIAALQGLESLLHEDVDSVAPAALAMLERARQEHGLVRAPEPEPEPEPVPEPEFEPESETAPEPAPEFDPDPEPNPVPEFEPESEPEPAPGPEPGADPAEPLGRAFALLEAARSRGEAEARMAPPLAGEGSRGMQGLGGAFALRRRLRPAVEQDSPLKTMHLALARLHALRPEPPVRQRMGLLSILAAFFRRLFGKSKPSPQGEAESLPAPSGRDVAQDQGVAVEHVSPVNARESQSQDAVQTSGDDDDRQRAASVRPLGEEPDLPATAAECEKRGEECRQRGDGEAAERFLARALQLLEKMHGPEHSDVARVCNSLGELYKRMGELDKAVAMHERSLAIREGLWGGQHQEVAQSCTNLGSVYRQMGRFAEALGLYRRALELDELLLGPEDPETATDFNNLAVLYFSMERYAEALRNIRRSIAIRELVLGDAHPHLSQAFENCAVILRKLGRNREADEMKARGSEVRARFEKLLAEREQNG